MPSSTWQVFKRARRPWQMKNGMWLAVSQFRCSCPRAAAWPLVFACRYSLVSLLFVFTFAIVWFVVATLPLRPRRFDYNAPRGFRPR